MPEGPKSSEKTIEMRLAEIEDKLAQLHITEDEIRAYNKVSNLLGGQGGGVQYTPDPTSTVCIVPRQVSRFINRGGIIPRINRGICECNECQCGPCGFGGGYGYGSGGFGGFGY